MPVLHYNKKPEAFLSSRITSNFKIFTQQGTPYHLYPGCSILLNYCITMQKFYRLIMAKSEAKKSRHGPFMLHMYMYPVLDK